MYSFIGQSTKKVIYIHVHLNIEGSRQVKEKHELKEGVGWFINFCHLVTLYLE